MIGFFVGKSVLFQKGLTKAIPLILISNAQITRNWPIKHNIGQFPVICTVVHTRIRSDLKPHSVKTA